MAHKNPAAVALGSIRSERKAASSRENGKKGGRPRKPSHVCALCGRSLGILESDPPPNDRTNTSMFCDACSST